MLKKTFFLLLAGLSSLTLGRADTLQLKDKATISGKILVEKHDQVAVDVGYTVLLVPRNQIVKIIKSEAAEAASKTNSASKPAAASEAVQATNCASALYTASASAAPTKSVRELVSLLGESVVQVRTPGGLGSGFILDPEGFLITNFHVIEGETQISVEVYHQTDGQLERHTYRQARIVAINKFADLALLKIDDKDAPRFKHIVLGSADALSVGEGVFAIGSPLGLERTVTEGIVSTKTRQLAGTLYLQTTAQINPGNSGGPLFNMSGEVIGVTNMKITFGEGLGFAIPVEEVKYFLDHRDAFAYSNDNPSNPYRYLQPPSHTRQAVVGE